MTTQNYKVLKPIGWNGRREKGEVVKLTDEEASAYSSEYIELVTPVVVKEVEEIALENKPLETLKFAELKELAVKLGLDANGSKADLLERITLARQ